MRLDELTSLYSVARYHSFSRAGLKLRLAQSTVSTHVKSLEDEFGVSLIERHGRPVRLTSEGTAFLQLAAPILKGIGILKIGMAHPETHGSIVVGVYHNLVINHLPKVIQLFQNRYPGVRIWLRSHPYEQLMQLVSSGEVDLALCSPPTADHPSLKFMELFQRETVLMAPKGHPLLSHRLVMLQEIGSWPLILTSPESLSRQVVERTMKDHGVDYEVVLTLDNTESIKRYVEIGMGVGICSDFALQPEDHEKFGVVSLAHLFPSTAIGVCTLVGKYTGNALRNFTDALQAMLSVASSPGATGNGSEPEQG